MVSEAKGPFIPLLKENATNLNAKIFFTYLCLKGFFRFSFITSGLLRPLTVGLLRGISDGLLKPILSVLHNGFLVPLAVFVHNISLALHTALVPIGSIITIGAEALSRLLQSCRLVEIHVNSEDLCNSYAKRGSRKGTKMPESV